MITDKTKTLFTNSPQNKSAGIQILLFKYIDGDTSRENVLGVLAPN